MQFQNLRDFQPTLVKPKSLIYIEFLCQLFLYLIYLGSNFVFQQFGFYLFIVGCAGSSLLRGLFFSRGKWGLLFSRNAWASHRGDLSYAGAGALGHTGSIVVAPGSRARAQQLRHGMWDLPPSGIKPVSPALAGGFCTATPARKTLKF